MYGHTRVQERNHYRKVHFRKTSGKICQLFQTVHFYFIYFSFCFTHFNYYFIYFRIIQLILLKFTHFSELFTQFLHKAEKTGSPGYHCFFNSSIHSFRISSSNSITEVLSSSVGLCQSSSLTISGMAVPIMKSRKQAS